MQKNLNMLPQVGFIKRIKVIAVIDFIRVEFFFITFPMFDAETSPQFWMAWSK